MGHATHFLERLERLPVLQLDFALELYRNSALIRFILEHSRLPDGADRVALAVDARPGGPHIIVARDGGFVTCLGEGMSVGDRTIIARGQLDRLSQRYDSLREATARVRDRSEIARLYDNLIQNGDALSREDFCALTAIVPLVEQDFVETIADMADFVAAFQRDYRRSRFRRPNKAAVRELRQYWMTWRAIGHLVALCGTRGLDMGDALFDTDKPPTALIPHALSLVAMQSAIPAVMLRGAWTAARGGRKVVARSKKILQAAESFMDIITSALPLVVTALRHRNARGEVRKLLARSLRRIEQTLYGADDLDVSRALLEAWVTVFDPGVEDEARSMHRALGAEFALRRCAHLPVGHPERFESREEVPDELAFALLTSLDGDIFNDNNTLLGMSVMMPWLAAADVADLYLPARWLETYAVPWTPNQPLAQLDALDRYFVREPLVHEQPKPGRNQPCPCGSGKKYKRCCI